MSAIDPAMMGPCENPGYSLYSQFIWSFFHSFNPRPRNDDGVQFGTEYNDDLDAMTINDRLIPAVAMLLRIINCL